ncbi:MAG: cob(I)yrinic acid a,c-diamide adenosyltransferase, partial [Alphaproteobacteria bacterium]|nr:cob(I)yrinic acid a,c-diamide adenosyltransferase [Alphaproteobacteria bacterium]
MENKFEKILVNPNWEKHGYIQVYTGNGKGKTTASLGLAMRALGRDWKVLIVMFTKGGDDYGELISFRKLSPKIKANLKIVQAGLDRIVYQKNKTEDDAKAVKEGWEIAKKAIQDDEYNLIILDEAHIA